MRAAPGCPEKAIVPSWDRSPYPMAEEHAP
jgi:hypothetical protein